jgi:hypothetical protein
MFINTSFLVAGPSILVYISLENQQMHQNYHFIVMLIQMPLHVSAHQRHHQGAHRKKNGLSSEVSPISNFALRIVSGYG